MLTAIHALVTEPVQIFLIVLVIILFAPILLNKLKIPHIIGMIVAGVIIGPYGFKVLDNDSSFAIFGQVGLLYLMFLAGLEIDMFHLKLNLKRGLFFGFLTLFIPLILGVLTSVYLLHLDWLTAMLLGSMYASHTLISYPVAVRFGITRAPAVLIAIVGTIIAVIGALLVLAAAVNVKREGVFDPGAIMYLIAKLVIWCLALLYAYPRITRWFFKAYRDKVTQYVFILAMVFLAACSAQMIGLESVLGAFLAGLILNRYVSVGSPLMTSIEFVGNALFIPYFLISVGMMINLRVIFNPGTLAVSAIMLAVALIGKWLPALIAQRVNGLGKSSRLVLFGLTTAHTAVALAVVTTGYNLGMFDERVLNSTVLVILVTCAAAPIITALGAPKLKIHLLDSEGDDLLKTVRINNSLIAVANPITVSALVEMVVLMRNDRGRHNFYALHVRNENSTTAKSISKNSLTEAVNAGASADINITALDRYDLNFATGMLNVIEERDITEIILGMHLRTTVIDSFFGSKVDELLRATNKMVIISRCFIPPSTLTRIVVWVPVGAQYETGFSRWVRAIARLTRRVGCRVIFNCTEEIRPLIRGVLHQESIDIRCEFDPIEAADDFIVHTSKILDDDLLVIIGARANSVSYATTMTEMPAYLQKYLSRNNLMMIYPEQFGEQPTLTSFVDPMASDISTMPSPIWSKMRNYRRKFATISKKILKR
jgi:Kef-type K+ transport system membrane component KefB